MNVKQINLHIDRKLHERLKILASVRGESMREMIEELLKKFCEVEFVKECIKLEKEYE